jgi:hypothetical protein
MDAKYYARLCQRMWEGDDVLDQYIKAAIKDGFIDKETQEWISEDDE